VPNRFDVIQYNAIPDEKCSAATKHSMAGKKIRTRRMGSDRLGAAAIIAAVVSAARIASPENS
jgi:hypothetical protein